MSCLITMSQKELHCLEVIQKIHDERLSVVQAAELLNLIVDDQHLHADGLHDAQCSLFHLGNVGTSPLRRAETGE